MSDVLPSDPFELARLASERLADLTGVGRHQVAVVLGSGWSGAAELLGETVATVDAADIPGFAHSGVPGHSGQLRSIALPSSGGHALILGARTHLYEGRGTDAVAHGVRTAAAAGASTLVLTNGCGGLQTQWSPGTTVLIRDHLNLTGATPLRGANFQDLTDLYSPRLRAIAHEIDPGLAEGVYAQFHGPQYETPAEVRMAGIMGADLVGMSTALEAIAARQVGLEVLGISLVTNLAAGISPEPLSHEEVMEAGRQAGPRISDLLAKIIHRIVSQ
ncbi:purine-nucleoside phosphorylase [Micrococcales bacterium KH10]|nr:purine-nucleoside phosphorylase [Micrococcales bacterium KH10]